MKTLRILGRMSLVILFMSVISACSPKPVDVTLTTYDITLDRDTASAGQVTFHIHNDADDGKTHEFVIFKTDLPEDQLPVDADGVVDEEGQGITFIDEREDIEAGQSVDMTIDLDSGRYVLLCNIDSDEMHYQHGMHTVFTVR